MPDDTNPHKMFYHPKLHCGYKMAAILLQKVMVLSIKHDAWNTLQSTLYLCKYSGQLTIPARIQVRQDSVPPTWGYRSALAAQSKVDYRKCNHLHQYESACVTRDRWYLRGWDIGPTFDGPSWMPTPRRATSVHIYQPVFVNMPLVDGPGVILYLLYEDTDHP